MFPPAILACAAFWNVSLILPQVASEASVILMVKSWMSGRDAIRFTPGTFPPSLGGRNRRDVYSTYIGKDRLNPTRKEKLWSKICSQSYMEQGRCLW